MGYDGHRRPRDQTCGRRRETSGPGHQAGEGTSVATKEEIIAAIRQGIERVERTFGGLTDEQLQTQVHTEESGWTARDILTHLAGRARGYEMMTGMAGATPPPPRPGGFDVNA